MKTSELLTKYPQLTHKKLREWAGAGFLNPADRIAAEGHRKGTYNEWDDDTSPRIELILQHSSKRIDKDRIAMVLIANGYYIGEAWVQKIAHKCIARIRGQQLVKRADGSVVYGGRTLKDNPQLQAIAVGVLNTANGHYRDGLPTTDRPSDITPTYFRQVVTLAVHKLFHRNGLHDRWLDTITNDEWETAFYDSVPFTRMFTPIAGALAGFDYGDSPRIEYLRDKLGQIKLRHSTDKLEFEAIIRILTMLGIIIIGQKRDEIDRIMRHLMRYSSLFPPKVEAPEAVKYQTYPVAHENQAYNRFTPENLTQSRHYH